MIKLEGFRLILASQSPRRRELLAGLGLDFDVKVKPIAEDYPEELAVTEVAGFLAKKKAEAYRPDIGTDEIVLTSDTVVILGGKILGKPVDASEAKSMLKALSGKSHLVVTGISFTSATKQVTESDTAVVYFRDLSEGEIDFYIESFKPFDKAGAYGIQEWIGFIGVEKIEGSFFTVMGLPLHLVYQVLKSWNC
ncbi:Septum formation protein Maf [Mariniradius saccharolyticus AK6]|uniref:dTTP/UTP pyrophosphatase n=1 Tax=Mariniradius saccharolyticus AK6 TaxID=1239962 RepID=M7X4N8_9BACT|nr:Maf family nucleotide pyrophosphatase [Mariniradius saccharolyticus]EMS32390.1 Septum formation protein Maf [Mariniradius saccharolyticus AK6]